MTLLRQAGEACARQVLEEPPERNTCQGTDSLRRTRQSRGAAHAVAQNHPRQSDRAFSARGMPDNRHYARRSQTEIGQCPASVSPSARERFQRLGAFSFASGFLNLISYLPMPCASYQWSSASRLPYGERCGDRRRSVACTTLARGARQANTATQSRARLRSHRDIKGEPLTWSPARSSAESYVGLMARRE